MVEAAGPHGGCYGNPSHMCSILEWGGLHSCWGAGGNDSALWGKKAQLFPSPQVPTWLGSRDSEQSSC